MSDREPLDDGRAADFLSYLSDVLDIDDDGQLAAIGKAVQVYPAGFFLNADRVDDIATCDSLVELGFLDRIEGIEAVGDACVYRASEETLRAMTQSGLAN